MKGTESVISTKSAARILQVNPRTIRRYAEKQLLESLLDPEGYIFHKEDVLDLKSAIDLKKNFQDEIKEIYSLKKCGAELSSIICQFDINPKAKIESALNLYDFEREQYLRRFNFEKDVKDDVLLVTEATARLRIRDFHVIYDLIAEKELKGYEKDHPTRKRFFVSLESFKRYLGGYIKEKFYTSRDASKITGKSVNNIDRIAKSHNLGMKIKYGYDNSIYLFSLAEVHALKYLKRNK